MSQEVSLVRIIEKKFTKVSFNATEDKNEGIYQAVVLQIKSVKSHYIEAFLNIILHTIGS